MTSPKLNAGGAIAPPLSMKRAVSAVVAVVIPVTSVRQVNASVTVVARDCAWADAMATALFVMGSERGEAFATQRGMAACFLERGAHGRVHDRQTPAFAQLGATRVPA